MAKRLKGTTVRLVSSTIYSDFFVLMKVNPFPMLSLLRSVLKKDVVNRTVPFEKLRLKKKHKKSDFRQEDVIGCCTDIYEALCHRCHNE